MNISGSSITYASNQAQSLLASILQRAGGAGQNQPGGDSASASGAAAAGAPPPGPSPGGGAQAFTTDTLRSLLSLQESPGSASSSANPLADLIKSADTDGDGKLSADELKTVLGGSATNDLSAKLAKLDTDGDGKLSSDELTAAMKAQHGGHAHRAHHARASSDDVAAKLLSDVDGDGSLSQDEIAAALSGSGDGATDLTSSFGRLDTDGDGKLGASELSAALTAFRQAHARTGQAQAA